MTTRHYELLKASVYYGRRTPGWVLLGNGHVIVHSSDKTELVAMKARLEVS